MSEANEQSTAVDSTAAEPPPAERDATSSSSNGGRFGALRQRFDDSTWLAVLGGLGVFISAVALYTRFPFTGGLGRDESIYAYEAQQFSRGHAPYASIFDPKTPGSGILGGIAAFVAHQFHANDLHAIRLMFLLLSILTAVAVYLCTLQLFGSVLGAFAAGMTFTFFTKFAHDAIIGPDAKTPAVLFLVLCMLFLSRRNWFTGAVFAGLAFACWQPIFPMALIAVVAATAAADARHVQPAARAGAHPRRRRPADGRARRSTSSSSARSRPSSARRCSTRCSGAARAKEWPATHLDPPDPRHRATTR